MNDVYKKIKLIAFYLPQYHPIPENDEWWGKGFTDWTNVVKAKPLFKGHYQPRIPSDLGCYDLRMPEVKEAQANLAQEHGIHGFCYYHYWFNGKRVLERPFEEVLSSGKPDFPFCLCWANENWTRTWSGGDEHILLKQEYSEDDDRAHIKSLLPAFSDKRYIKVNGKPLFLVYRIELLPNPKKTAEIWRGEAVKAGIGDIYLGVVESVKSINPKTIGFDVAVEFAPHWRDMLAWKSKSSRFHKKLMKFGLIPKIYADNFITSYQILVDTMLKDSNRSYKRFRCVTPSFDNSPRREKQAAIFTGSTPQKYETWLKRILEWTMQEHEGDERLVFINAWNEWGEGNHLEPDKRWGKCYLEATKAALDSITTIDDIRRSRVKETKEKPIASIVILTKNGGALFRRSIKNILSQKTTFTYEVVIVDTGSTDGTLEFLRSFPEVTIYEISPKNFRFGPTRDFGFSKAKGEFVVTISQDVVPVNENWLENLARPLLKDETDVVQGQTCARTDRKIFFWEDRDYFFFTSESKSFHKNNGNIGLSCANLAIKKDVWERTRFGDALMSEDKALQKRLFASGYRMVRKRDALCYHGHTYNLKSLMKRCENEGMGWRKIGVKYSFTQMLNDLKHEKWLYGMVLKKIIKREMTNLAEILFLFIRPIFLYKGNLMNKGYKF